MKKHKISHSYRNSQKNNDKTLSFVLGLHLFFCPIAVQAEDVEPLPQEEIVEAPSEDALNYLLGEDIYQGTLSWQGNKAPTKFNYHMKKAKR